MTLRRIRGPGRSSPGGLGARLLLPFVLVLPVLPARVAVPRGAPVRLDALVSSPAGRAEAEPPRRSASVAEATAAEAAAEGPWLGVQVAPEPERPGVRLEEVVPGSPAAAAGLRSGDVVLRASGDGGTLTTFDVEGFVQLVRGVTAGATLRLEIAREGESPSVVEPVLGRRLEAAAHALAAAVRANRFLRRERADDIGAVIRAIRRTAREAASGDAAWLGFARALGRFGVSHTTVVPPWSWTHLLRGERRAKRTARSGLALARWPLDAAGTAGAARRGWFVAAVAPGGAAERAGVQRGDRVIAVDGLDPGASPRTVLAGQEAERGLWTLRVVAGDRVVLRLRRRRGEDPFRAEVVCARKRSGLDTTRASVRILQTPAGPAGYLRFTNLLAEDLPSVLRDVLEGELAGARGLLLDLRGRGGSTEVLDGVEDVLRDDGRPLVALIGPASRSAQEVLAWRLREGGAVLVGKRTAGAVRPAQWRPLPDGSVAMLPVAGAVDAVLQLTGGEDLEGRGVIPDIPVEGFDRRWSAGRDPVLERGREEIARHRAGRPRRVRI